jgi:hypothetical protein
MNWKKIVWVTVASLLPLVVLAGPNDVVIDKYDVGLVALGVNATVPYLSTNESGLATSSVIGGDRFSQLYFTTNYGGFAGNLITLQVNEPGGGAGLLQYSTPSQFDGYF